MNTAEKRQSESREHWEKVWSAASRREPRDIWYAIDERKMTYLRPHLPKSGSCLEVGCGSARLSRFLARLGYRTVGMDYEATAIKTAARRVADDGLEVGLLLGDAFALPFASDSLDIVLSTGLLEHFADPSPIVAEMTRVLRPGGLFYSDIVPKKFSLMRSLQMATFRRRDVWERPFNRRQIEALLERSGLTLKAVFAAGILPPLVPLLGRSRRVASLEEKAAVAFSRVSHLLDGSRAAEMLGIYYFACATKPERDVATSKKPGTERKAA